MLRRYRARVAPPLQVRFRDALIKNNGDVLKGLLALNGQTRRLHEIRGMFLPRLLKWDDRNSMAFSVESRYPFLDHELIELCLSFAPKTLYRRGWTKYPLRLGLNNHMPLKIRDRRSKFGFETPQDKWFGGALRPELESWLRSDRPVWDYVEREDVRRMAEQTWRLHGKRDETCQDLFRIFVFDRWLSTLEIH